MNISKNMLAIALLFSIAINLLILGAAGGIAVAGLRHPPPSVPIAAPRIAPGNFQFNPRRFIRALPEAERHKAMLAMKSASGKHRRIYRKIRQTHRELGMLLSAETLDEKRIQAAFGNLRKLEIEVQSNGQNIILEILRDLDPQTRKRVILAASRPDQKRQKKQNEMRRRQ
jgi:uncharacterized membrane protein